jgi:hypothetical protein
VNIEENFHVSFHRFGSENVKLQDEVDACAREVLTILRSPNVKEQIEQVHHLGASSQQIQKVIETQLGTLGFVSERKGLFLDFDVPGLRPDFYRPLDDDGILFEVERGKTLANNMDLLDVWKTHLCRQARHLFLLVPIVRVTKKGANQKIFGSVVNRVGSFFSSDLAQLDVDSVNIFGY